MPTIDSISPAPAPVAEKQDTPAKIENAAKQFEALLIGQILKSMQEATSSGWLGEEDQAGQAAMGLAQEQFAQALAAHGGFGLARLITQGISAEFKQQTAAHDPQKPSAPIR